MECKFFNPIAIAQVAVPGDLFYQINELSDSLLNQPQHDYTGSDLTLRGGKQQRVWPNETSNDISWLSNWIESQARLYQQQVCNQAENWDAMHLHPKLMNCWTISQEEHSYQVTHCHPYGNISGNLYLEVPKLDKKSSKTDCCISFLFDQAQDLRQLRLRDSLHYFPKVGTMLIFPSWLPHQVYPWKGTGSRRVLAWDCNLI